MELKTIILRMINMYFIIYGGSIIATLLFCLLFYPDVQFGLDYFSEMLLFSLLGDIPFLVFYSKRELTETELRVRKIIHLMLLEIVLLTAGKRLDMYSGVKEGAVFVITILGIYALISFLMIAQNTKVADQINKKLEERRKEKKVGE